MRTSWMEISGIAYMLVWDVQVIFLGIFGYIGCTSMAYTGESIF